MTIAALCRIGVRLTVTKGLRPLWARRQPQGMEEAMTEKVEPTDQERRMRALKLIRLMKGDVVTAMQTEQPLVVEGNGPLTALMTVIEVAEHATLKEMAPVLGSDGKVVKL